MTPEYSKRTYRGRFSVLGRKSFTVKYKETDLWIGVDSESYQPQMPEVCLQLVIELRRSMDLYLDGHKGYARSLVPYDVSPDDPEILKMMARASAVAGIGPMSAVAGAVAKYVAIRLMAICPYREIIVENGGDIYANLLNDIDIAVFAGASPLSEKVGLHIPASACPLGICTSSGTVGPSLSFGRADAVMVVCSDVLLADSYATAMANMVKTSDDIPPVIGKIGTCPDILSAIVVKDDKMAITGIFKLRIFSK